MTSPAANRIGESFPLERAGWTDKQAVLAGKKTVVGLNSFEERMQQ
jgi:hypothetical protein